jgi:Ca2+-binding RTX toxin-like protein
MDWACAFKYIAAFRRADFSLLPPVRILSSSEMPGLWGGYSRDTREIYLSADCPQELLSAVFIEEIGHFLDQEICAEETPGEEGARFAAAVLGLPLDDASSDDSLAPLFFQGRELLVEAARKSRGSFKGKSGGISRGKKRGSSKDGGSKQNGGSGYAEIGSKSSNPKLQQNIIYATEDGARIPQKAAGDRLIGSRGNDTFAVISQDVKIEDPNGGTDTVEALVTFDLTNHSIIENLLLTGGANINGTGNRKANVISGNSGNNKLDGGIDSAIDTLQGGAGNDTYALRDTLDKVVEAAGGGTDTIETVLNVASLVDFAADNVENLTYTGNLSATLSGNALANVLTGGNQADTIFGAAGDTLVGREGNDLFTVQSSSVYIFEGDGPLDGQDTVSTALSIYSIAPFANVEVLEYTGSRNSSLTGNSGNNIVYGALLPRNTINGGAGDDYLFGGDGTDSLLGDSGNDTLAVTSWLGDPVGSLGASLRSGVGSDTLKGDAGDDWYVVNSQTAYTFQEVAEYNDPKDPTKRTDSNTIASTVTYSLAYNANISTNIQNLFLLGAANISGTGNSLNNVITGNDGNNHLSSGVGNDTVYGGLGADVVTGENGNDTLYGGGQPQTDLPADASTSIDLAIGGAYQGKIDFRRDTDWLRVSLQEGVTYYFRIIPDFGTNPNSEFSDIAFGFRGNDDEQGFTFTTDKQYFGLVGDKFWLYNHTELVLNSNGLKAYGAIETGDFQKNPGKTNNIWGFSFTAFNTGEFYVPISGSGPAIGSYTVFLSEDKTLLTKDKKKLLSVERPVLADDASNTLIGGLGNDYLVAGGGRDSAGNIIGDTLLGGSNGIPGSIDQDTLSGQNKDTLIGAGGADVLDGGKGADSMIGGGGSDTYYVDSISDQIVETDNGGSDDLGIFDLTPGRGRDSGFSLDLEAGLFALTSSSLSSATGVGFDVDLANVYANVEHASLMGSANLYILGNGDGNSLIGNFGSNLLVGALGNDSLLGQGGNDYLIGGDGGDLLDGGSGVNTMDGGLGSDTYIINDRADRIINEEEGLDGGIDLVRTYFNFDPLQGDGVNQYDPAVADNSPSVNKAKSFASEDLKSFYNLENFELLGGAVYGVGNALANSIIAGPASSVLYGMGGEDIVLGGAGDDTLYGDTPDFYASPDIYAAAPKDTRTKAFIDGVIGSATNDYLNGGGGDNYLDGGRGFDVMIGGDGNDTFVQDNVDDYIVAGRGANELITSVNINQAPDGISKLMLVVAKQAADSGQREVASFASFLGTKNGNNRSIAITTGLVDLSLKNANTLELIYAPREGEVFANEDGSTPAGASDLIVGDQEDDLKNPGKFQCDLSWTAGANAATDVVGYTVRYKKRGGDDIWYTYVNGKSQDFQGTQANPILTVTNLEDGTYDFQVTAIERTIPALQARSAAQHVTLQGGAGNDAVIGFRLIQELPGGLVDDVYTDPLIQNNPNFGLPIGFIFNPTPYNSEVDLPNRFATYLDGGYGNDILNGDFVNDHSGDDYVFQGVTFKGLNTLVGGQGSDTFVVKNGGNAIGDECDWVVKYGNETPVDYGAGGVGASLNGGQHNLVVSRVDFLTLSDELVNQGKFIDQLALAEAGQFGQGNRLDNYIYDLGLGNTLVGDKGRDSIVGAGEGNFLIGGTAYGVDQVGLAVKDFASVVDGGNGLKNSIFRDTDPIPVSPNGPGTADPSQFWFVPGYYGGVYDPNRNQDTLVANDFSDIDGGAGRDSMVGSKSDDQVAPGKGDMFYVSQGIGTNDFSHDILFEDAVFGNGGNDTVTFTDSDYLWWSGHLESSLLLKNRYTIAYDISNLILQAGSPSARNAAGNHSSAGNYGVGSNAIQGNEFDNVIDGGGVGGEDGTGVGVDILIGGSGKDNFLVSGYTASKTNEWAPSIIDYTQGPLAGYSVWEGYGKSTYTDADYVVISDFEVGDNLKLPDAVSNYWIGAAPADDSIPEKFEKNIPLLDYLEKPNTTRFGIYDNSDKPNLVAIVNLVGGLALDTLTLDLVDDWDIGPDSDGRYKQITGSPNSNYLGWGTFWELEGSSFAQYVNKAYLQDDSFASLTTLVRSGDDTFIGGVLADFYNGYGGNDSLLGGAGSDTFLGGVGNDSLFGEGGNDSLLGEAGADYLSGGAAADQLIGGKGDDTYVVDEFDIVREELNEGTDLAISSVNYNLAVNFENLLLTGTNAINGTGNTLGNRLTGNSLNNTLTGLAGDDTLDGGVGTDTLIGGGGDDFYIVDNTGDTIEEHISILVGGIDTISTSASFTLGTGIEHLVYTGTTTGVELTGNATANSITGGAGSDTLDGQVGIDTLIGGAGDDFYILTTTNTDVIVENAGSGTDTVLIDGTFSLSSMPHIENIELTAAVVSVLTGNSQDNLIVGNILNDNILGEGGNDTLTGTSALGSGEIDTFTGGTGADLFMLGNSASVFYDNLPGAGDYAYIRDFSVEQGDKLQLHGGATYFFDAGAGSQSLLYRDSDGNLSLSVGDNLIADIIATGGSGENKNLVFSDLAKIAVYA